MVEARPLAKEVMTLAPHVNMDLIRPLMIEPILPGRVATKVTMAAIPVTVAFLALVQALVMFVRSCEPNRMIRTIAFTTKEITRAISTESTADVIALAIFQAFVIHVTTAVANWTIRAMTPDTQFTTRPIKKEKAEVKAFLMAFSMSGMMDPP